MRRRERQVREERAAADDVVAALPALTNVFDDLARVEAGGVEGLQRLLDVLHTLCVERRDGRLEEGGNIPGVAELWLPIVVTGTPGEERVALFEAPGGR